MILLFFKGSGFKLAQFTGKYFVIFCWMTSSMNWILLGPFFNIFHCFWSPNFGVDFNVFFCKMIIQTLLVNEYFIAVFALFQNFYLIISPNCDVCVFCLLIIITRIVIYQW